MLDKEFKYFKDHQTELVKLYKDRFVVISEEKVIGNYTTEAEAYTESIKTHKAGTFLIQKCIAGEEAYKQMFNSRVAFA